MNDAAHTKLFLANHKRKTDLFGFFFGSRTSGAIYDLKVAVI